MSSSSSLLLWRWYYYSSSYLLNQLIRYIQVYWEYLTLECRQLHYHLNELMGRIRIRKKSKLKNRQIFIFVEIMISFNLTKYYHLIGWHRIYIQTERKNLLKYKKKKDMQIFNKTFPDISSPFQSKNNEKNANTLFFYMTNLSERRKKTFFFSCRNYHLILYK